MTWSAVKNFYESILIDKNRCRLIDLFGQFDRVLVLHSAFSGQRLGIKLCGTAKAICHIASEKRSTSLINT